SFYLPAILGAPIAHALGIAPTLFFGLFSGALLLSAGTAPLVGQLIDRHGGRAVLAASNLVLSAGLALLGMAQGVASLTIAWIVLGVGMAMGLYDPAFAALTRLYGRAARAPITGITLIAGFASTISWAALNLLVAMPLNWWAIPPAPPLLDPSETSRDAVEPEAPRGAMPVLAFFFSATRFVS